MAIADIISIKLGPTDTGLTLSAKLYNSSGVQQGSEITTGFVEIGNGEYSWYYASFADDFVGIIKFFSTGSVFQCSTTYKATSTDNAEVLAAIEDLGSNPITVVSLFDAGTSNLNLTRGDDYVEAIDTEIRWSSDAWPQLIGDDVSVLFSAKDAYSGQYDLEDIECTIVLAGASEQTVSLELTNAQTQALAIGTAKYIYDIQASIDGSRVTLVRGTITVHEDVADQ